MSGDVQPRKRKEKRRKRADQGYHIRRIQIIEDEDAGTPPPTLVNPAEFLDNIAIHIHKEGGTGGHWCAKILFFALLTALVGLIGLMIFEYRGSADVDTPIESSRWAMIFDGWVDEVLPSHDEDPHGESDDKDEDDHDEEDEGHGDDEDHDDDDDEDDDDHDEEEEQEGEEENDENEEVASEETGSNEEDEESIEDHLQSDQEKISNEEDDDEDENRDEDDDDDDDNDDDDDDDDDHDDGDDEYEDDEKEDEYSRENFSTESDAADSGIEDNDNDDDDDDEYGGALEEVDEGEEENDNDDDEDDVADLSFEILGILGVDDDDDSNEPLEEIEGEDELEGVTINDPFEIEDEKEQVIEEEEEESSSVAVKFGVGVALVVAAHFVLVRRWRYVDEGIEMLSSEAPPNSTRRETIVSSKPLLATGNASREQKLLAEESKNLQSDNPKLISTQTAGKDDREASEGELYSGTEEELTTYDDSEEEEVGIEDEEAEEDEEEEEEDEEEGEEEEEESQQGIIEVDDARLISKLENKYGKLPTPSQSEEEMEDEEEEEEEEEDEESLEENEPDNLHGLKRAIGPTRLTSNIATTGAKNSARGPQPTNSQGKSGGRQEITTNDFDN